MSDVKKTKDVKTKLNALVEDWNNLYSYEFDNCCGTCLHLFGRKLWLFVIEEAVSIAGGKIRNIRAVTDDKIEVTIY